MTNWKIFQTTSRHPSPNYIVFWLDDYVNYSNGGERYIYCENTYPYYDWEAGDDIKIDIDRTCYYKSGHNFNDNNILRISSSNSGSLVRVQSNYSSL